MPMMDLQYESMIIMDYYAFKKNFKTQIILFRFR